MQVKPNENENYLFAPRQRQLLSHYRPQSLDYPKEKTYKKIGYKSVRFPVAEPHASQVSMGIFRGLWVQTPP